MAATSPLRRMHRMLLVHQDLDAGRHGDPPACRGRRRRASTGASQPSTARPTRPRPVPGACSSGQPVGPRQRGAQHAGHPALDEVAGEPGELAGHGLQRGAFHLPQLDGEHLEQVAVGVHRGRSPAVGRAHQPARHVEADGSLARPGPRRRVDRHHARCVEDAAGERGQVAQPPRCQRAVLPQGGQRIGRRGDDSRRSCGSVARCGSSRAGPSSAPSTTCPEQLEGERLEQERAAPAGRPASAPSRRRCRRS